MKVRSLKLPGYLFRRIDVEVASLRWYDPRAFLSGDLVSGRWRELFILGDVVKLTVAALVPVSQSYAYSLAATLFLALVTSFLDIDLSS